MQTKENSRNLKLPAAWKILIVDDVLDVHHSLKLKLKYLKIEGVKLKFLDAYNPEEAIELIKENRDIAVVLLDIVMANDKPGGYNVEKFIRDELGDTAMRIIVRTGEPGHPEREVVENYKIDDYLDKLKDKDREEAALITAIRAFIEIKVRDAQNEVIRNLLTDNI